MKNRNLHLLTLLLLLCLMLCACAAEEPQPSQAAPETPAPTLLQTEDPAPVPEPAPSLVYTPASLEDPEDLLKKLADSSIEAVSLQGKGVLNPKDQALVLTKPLLIESQSEVHLIQPMEIAPGGQLLIQGHLQAEGLLQTTGGQITVDATGSLSSGHLLLRQDADLTVENGGALSDTTGVTVLSDSLFENAVHVSTQDGLYDAMKDSSIESVIVDVDLELTYGYFSQVKPILIPANVTIHAKAWSLTAGCTLVNYGTIDADLEMLPNPEDTVNPYIVLNYGTIDSRCFLTPSEKSGMNEGSVFFNLGQITNASAMAAVGVDFYNLGSVSIEPLSKQHNGFWIADSRCYNSGLIELTGRSGSEHWMNPGCNSQIFCNAGQLLFHEHSRLWNASELHNWGSISSDHKSAKLCNTALLENYGEIAPCYNDKELFGNILVQHPGAILKNVKSNWYIDLDAENTSFPWVTVHNTQEMMDALSGEDRRGVILSGEGTFQLQQDLELKQKTLVIGKAPLDLNGFTLTVGGWNSYLYGGDINANGGNLVLYAPSVVENICNVSSIQLPQDTSFLIYRGSEPLNNMNLSIQNGNFCNLGTLDMTNCKIEIGKCGLFNLNFLNLTDSSLSIASGGKLNTEGGRFQYDETTTISGMSKIDFPTNEYYQ